MKFWSLKCLIPTIQTMLQIQPCVACLCLSVMNDHVCRWPLFRIRVCLNIYAGSHVWGFVHMCLCRGCATCFWRSVPLLNPDSEVRKMERKSTSSSASAKDLKDRRRCFVLLSCAQSHWDRSSKGSVCVWRGVCVRSRVNIKNKSNNYLMHCDVQRVLCLCLLFLVHRWGSL